MPPTDVTGAVLSIAGRVLRRSDIGPTSDFFDVGGTSLAAIQMVDLIEQALSVRLSLTDFFDAPDFQAVAELVAERQPA